VIYLKIILDGHGMQRRDAVSADNAVNAVSADRWTPWRLLRPSISISNRCARRSWRQNTRFGN